MTVFNDLCLLAPGALVDPAIEWEEIDARQVRARYASGEHVVSAVLVFDDEGWLVDFFSDDRLAFTEGGPRRWRWSTPVSGYKAYGPVHAASRGAGWWHAPEGPFAYVELELVDLELNGGRETLHSPELRAHLHIHAQRPGTRPLRSGDPRSPSRSKDGTS